MKELGIQERKRKHGDNYYHYRLWCAFMILMELMIMPITSRDYESHDIGRKNDNCANKEDDSNDIKYNNNNEDNNNDW